MSKLNIILSGSTGKMGFEIKKIIEAKDGLSLSHKVSQESDGENSYTSFDQIKSPSENSVIIDFSRPELFKEALAFSLLHKVPMVSGTTGLSEADFNLIKEAGASTPVLWSSNMSLGIAFLRKQIKNYGFLKDFDFQVEETHHNKKVDSPSGTAKTLQEDLEKTLDKKLPPVLATRGGGVFGDHSISAYSDEEVIKLEHRALSRSVFAVGAVKAAQWLGDKKPGCYEFMDIL